MLDTHVTFSVLYLVRVIGLHSVVDTSSHSSLTLISYPVTSQDSWPDNVCLADSSSSSSESVRPSSICLDCLGRPGGSSVSPRLSDNRTDIASSIWSSESFFDMLLPSALFNLRMNAGLEVDVQTVRRNTNKIFI